MLNNPFWILAKKKIEPIVLLFTCFLWLIGAAWISVWTLSQGGVREGIFGLIFLVPVGAFGCWIFVREIRR